MAKQSCILHIEDTADTSLHEITLITSSVTVILLCTGKANCYSLFKLSCFSYKLTHLEKDCFKKSVLSIISIKV